MILLLLLACIPVEGEKILARDMARAWPAFAAVAEDAPVGYAPAPGALRRFTVAELARVAARHHVPAPNNEICFERPMETPDAARVREALARALAVPGARIEIEDFSRRPMPRGEMIFPREWLRAPPPGATAAVLWKGYVLYAGKRRFPIWARVRIAAPVARVRAVETLRAGEVIRPEQLAVETAEGFPGAGRDAETIAQAAGRRPRRTIPAGAVVPLALLEEVREVERGDTVRVAVASGAARLALTGRAESSGRVGEMVRVRNMDANRVFSARVAGKGAVTVDAGRIEK